HALRKAAQAEFAHGEGRRARIAFDAGGGAGEEDRAVSSDEHRACRRLRDEKAAVAGHEQRVQHFLGVEFRDGPARTRTWIIDDEIGRTVLVRECREQCLYIVATTRVAAVDA